MDCADSHSCWGVSVDAGEVGGCAQTKGGFERSRSVRVGLRVSVLVRWTLLP